MPSLKLPRCAIDSMEESIAQRLTVLEEKLLTTLQHSINAMQPSTATATPAPLPTHTNSTPQKPSDHRPRPRSHDQRSHDQNPYYHDQRPRYQHPSGNCPYFNHNTSEYNSQHPYSNRNFN